MTSEEVFDGASAETDLTELPDFEQDGAQFLEALIVRIAEIIRKPSGRFVISYVSGQPGSRRPPKIQ